MVIKGALLVGTLLAVFNSLFAQVPPEERIPIRDPDRLESMGFPRDAANVSAWSRANLAGSRQDSSDLLRPEAPETFGTADYGFSNVHGHQLEGERPGFAKFAGLNGTHCGLNSPDEFAVAQIQVPEGVSLVFFRACLEDEDADEDVYFIIWESCQPTFTAGSPSHTLLGQAFSTGSSGEQSVGLDLGGVTANNRNCAYTVVVRFANPNGLGVCPGPTLVVSKMRFQWRRQISPAPAVVAFADVPTNHLYFRAIEALADSGITLGCGSGNFCPNGNVTRGEMAAFLARALGLHFP